MKVVIVGDGKVGFTLTKELSQAGHEVVVIDNDQQVLQESQDVLDVMVVHGNGQALTCSGKQTWEAPIFSSPPPPAMK